MKKFLFVWCAAVWLASCGVGNTSTALNPTRANPVPNTTAVVSDGVDAMPTLLAITEDVSKQSIDCGDLSVSGSPLRASDTIGAQAAAACFMSAWNGCQPAVVTIRERATGVIRQFNIEGARSNCLIRQAFQPDANSAPAVVDCASATIQEEQLQIKNCSHLGDFILSLGN